MDADGGGLCLCYAEVQRKADEWFKLAARGFEGEGPRNGPYTVKDALADYMAAYRRKGGKSVDRTQWAIDALIMPDLGSVQLAKLTRRRIEESHEGLANAAPRLRTKPGKVQKFRKKDDSPDAIRRRRSSANRVLTVLKAALNHAHHARRVSSDDAWRIVKAFREADSARVRYLNDDEARRVVNHCSPDFRPIVQAALLTGCRYGELVALTVATTPMRDIRRCRDAPCRFAASRDTAQWRASKQLQTSCCIFACPSPVGGRLTYREIWRSPWRFMWRAS
jgi:integrase